MIKKKLQQQKNQSKSTFLELNFQTSSKNIVSIFENKIKRMLRAQKN